MNRVLAIVSTVLIYSCSDGDLQIEEINFEEVNIQNCGTLDTSTELLFKINQTEALILELEAGILANEASEGEIESTIPGGSQLTYRIFNEDIGTDYFCDAVPPPGPSVLENIEAESGEVRITTLQDPEDSTRFEHTIRLAGVSFINAAGERLTNLTVEDFGIISTTN